MSPDLKILLYIFLVIGLLFAKDIYLLITVSVFLSLFFIKIPFRKTISGWLPVTIFLGFTFISNLLNQHGKIIFSVGHLFITEEGLSIATIRSMRVLDMIMGAKLLMLTTKTDDIINTMERFFMPFNKIGIPVTDFFHSMGLTLKCFPLLKDMTMENYKMGLKARNAKGISEKAIVIADFILPMFIKTIQSPDIFFEREGKSEEKD